MYDNLLEEDPHIQEIVARAVEKHAVMVEKRVEVAEKRAESRTRNKFRETILDLVQDRFPALQDMVERKIAAIDNADALQKIILALALATDETAAHHYVTALEPVHSSEV